MSEILEKPNQRKRRHKDGKVKDSVQMIFRGPTAEDELEICREKNSVLAVDKLAEVLLQSKSKDNQIVQT